VIDAYAMYTKTTAGQQVPATGLTVTCTLHIVKKSDQSLTTTSPTPFEIGEGLYGATYSTSVDLTTYSYLFQFATTDATVQQTKVPGLQADFAASIAKNAAGAVGLTAAEDAAIAAAVGYSQSALLASLASAHGAGQWDSSLKIAVATLVNLAKNQPLSLFKGEDKLIQFTVYQADGITPQDITGWSISFVAHLVKDDGLTVITKTVGAGITLTSPTLGLLTLTLLAADTAGLPPWIYFYRIERTNAGSDTVLSYGDFKLMGK